MPLLPLKDDNPVVYIRFQYVTLAILLLCIGVYLWPLGLSGPALIGQFSPRRQLRRRYAD